MRKKVVAISVVAMALAVVGSVATPALAEVNGMNRIANVGVPNMCLDANGSGEVYTLACSQSRNQRWIIGEIEGYTIFKNETIDRCLDSNGHFEVYTLPCDMDSSNQKWERTEDKGEVRYKNHATGYYLDSNERGEVYAIAGNPGRNQAWQELATPWCSDIMDWCP